MRIKYLRSKLELFYFLLSFAFITFLMSFGLIGYIFSLFFVIAILLSILFKIKYNNEFTTIILLPIMLSIFQNIYLGMFSTCLTDLAIKILTILNFFIACFELLLLYITDKNKKSNLPIKLLFLVLVIYLFFSILFLEKFSLISILSSIRNIVSIFIFYFIGNIAYQRLDMRKFQMLLMFFGIIVIVVGLYEIFVNKNMWVNLNITELWTKKGLNLQPGGLPTNFYSSETINGERIRRMTSTFADPVNLGTFLFSIFCLNWFHGNKKGFILTLFAIILTVSKGALVGLLIFACIYAFVYHRKKFIYIALSMFALGVSFLVYAYITSANSVFLHISGLLSAFSILGTKPFGYGLGSVGVLSQQFSDVTANYSITETGLGMIIGQLGIIGLSIYLLYFIYIIFKCFKLNDKKEKVLCCTFILSILVNILFNEVALSPNSCAIYFIIVGYYLGMENNRKEKKDERFN